MNIISISILQDILIIVGIVIIDWLTNSIVRRKTKICKIIHNNNRINIDIIYDIKIINKYIKNVPNRRFLNE